MSPDASNQERQKLRRGISFHRALNIVQALCNLVMVCLLFWVVFNQRTILTPPEIRKEYEVGPSTANKEYLQDMAHYVLSSVLDVTPDNIDHRVRTVLKMTDPDGYPELKAALDSAATRIKKEQIATQWSPEKIAFSEKDMWVKVRGRIKTYIGDKSIDNSQKEYVVQFKITNSGRLYVKSLQEIVDTRTAGKQPKQ
jgi:conjugal transfer pilus assembly protein TraE